MLKTNEAGRSMVEMLGVLAIIGVLSVSGIAGYTSAIRSYRANEIVNATSMLYTMAATQNLCKGDKNLSYTAVAGSLPSGCAGIDYSVSNKTIALKVEDQAVCNQVKNKFGTKVTAGDCITPSSGSYTLTVTLGETTPVGNPSDYHGDSASCANAGFYYNFKNMSCYRTRSEAELGCGSEPLTCDSENPHLCDC